MALGFFASIGGRLKENISTWQKERICAKHQLVLFGEYLRCRRSAYGGKHDRTWNKQYYKVLRCNKNI